MNYRLILLVFFLVAFILSFSILSFAEIEKKFGIDKNFGNDFYNIKLLDKDQKTYKLEKIKTLRFTFKNDKLAELINYYKFGYYLQRFIDIGYSNNKILFLNSYYSIVEIFQIYGDSKIEKNLFYTPELGSISVSYLGLNNFGGTFTDDNGNKYLFLSSLSLSNFDNEISLRKINLFNRLSDIEDFDLKWFGMLNNGKLMAIGNVFWSKPGSDVLFARLNLDYSFDNSYNDSGFFVLDNIAGGNFSDIISEVEQDREGNIFVAGSSKSNGHCFDMFLVKLNGEGYPDKSFAKNGILIINNVAGGNDTDNIESMELTDKEIVIAGNSYDRNLLSKAVIIKLDKYTSNLISSFGNNGVKIIDSNVNSMVREIRIDKYGNIWALLTYFSNSKDPSFSYLNTIKIIQFDKIGQIINELFMEINDFSLAIGIFPIDSKVYLPIFEKVNGNKNNFAIRILRINY